MYNKPALSDTKCTPLSFRRLNSVQLIIRAIRWSILTFILWPRQQNRSNRPCESVNMCLCVGIITGIGKANILDPQYNQHVWFTVIGRLLAGYVYMRVTTCTYLDGCVDHRLLIACCACCGIRLDIQYQPVGI